MARWLVDMKSEIKGKKVLELGAGCGVAGLAAHVYCEPLEVIISDCNVETVENIRYVQKEIILRTAGRLRIHT